MFRNWFRRRKDLISMLNDEMNRRRAAENQTMWAVEHESLTYDGKLHWVNDGGRHQKIAIDCGDILGAIDEAMGVE